MVDSTGIDDRSLFFFHGLESAPHGTKYQRLSESFDVYSPDFQGMDIWERLEKAERVTEEMTDVVVVGSSYGGLLAALLYSRHPDRFAGYVLMAPALYLEAADQVERMPDNAVVIHGTHDEVVPIDAVRQKCAEHGLEVTEVDDGHRLHDSMELMVEAVEQVLDEARRRSTTTQNALLVGAVGDALGAPVEFMGARVIERTHGVEPPADLAFAGSAPARFTDDTQMTLFMAEGLGRAIDRGVAGRRERFRQEAARSLVHWLATQDAEVLEAIAAADSRLLGVPELNARRAPGNTCLTSCYHIHRGGELPDVDNRINDSKGCGAVMRSAPYGLAARSAEQAFGWAHDAGVLTHCHPSGYLSAAYFAAVIFGLGQGQGFEQAMAVADDLLAAEPDADETQQAVADARAAASGGQLSFEEMVSLGEGWVGEEALAIALAVAMTADVDTEEGIRQALWLAVRHSGDSDSTGAMAGSLIGAMCPPEAMPTRWVEQLELRDVVASCLGAGHRSE